MSNNMIGNPKKKKAFWVFLIGFMLVFAWFRLLEHGYIVMLLYKISNFHIFCENVSKYIYFCYNIHEYPLNCLKTQYFREFLKIPE